MPILQLLLPRDCGGYICEQLKMNQPIDPIFGGKPIRSLRTVLMHSLYEIGNAAKWMLKQVQHDEILYNQHSLLTQSHPELVSGSIVRFALDAGYRENLYD